MASDPGFVSESVEQYLLMLTVVDGRSPLTIASYESDLRALGSYFENEDALLSATSTQLDSYFANMRASGLKPATVARAMSSCRGYFRFLEDERIISADPSARLPVATRVKSLPKALSEELIDSLIDSMTGSGPLDIRDRLIVEFLYGTGARVSEMIAVEIQDVDMDEMLVRLTGKGSKQRLVPIGRALATALAAYLSTGGRHELVSAKSKSFLFINQRGGPLTRHGVNEILRRRALVGGVSLDGLHAHAFRHSCATHMIAHGADIRVVQELLGHSSIATTQRYTGVAITTLRSAYQSAHPRATSLP